MFQVFVGFLPVFVKGDWCEQLRAILFPSAFEINVKASPPGGYSMCWLKMHKLFSRKYSREIAQPFFLLTSFFIYHLICIKHT
jgi:hypothetical protein